MVNIAWYFALSASALLLNVVTTRGSFRLAQHVMGHEMRCFGVLPNEEVVS
ncbi:MAG: hypothetical protein OJF49_003840 [Ktedonobacterales bacterium]|nr:MAG: hypothetical protein OJF49_003840 [Ktedonobacterales bacterium]